MSNTQLKGKTIELEYKLGGSAPAGYRFESKQKLQAAVDECYFIQ